MTTTRSKTATFHGVAVIVAAIFVAAIITGANAQSPMMAPAPAPALDCMNAVLNMSDCLSFVIKGNNLTKPEGPCCSEFAGLVESSPICLCQLLGNPGSTGIELDVDKAMKLPKVCGVPTPSVTLCSAIGVPVSAPTASEGTGTGPGVTMGPSSPGSTTGSDSNDNGVSSIVVFDMTIFTGLVIAFIALFV